MSAPPTRLDPVLIERARRSLRRRDPALGRMIRRVGACELGYTGPPYHALLRSVLHQQLAGAAARAIEMRFKGHYGGRYPAAARLRETDPETLRGLGLSRQKAATVQRIAQAFDSGQLCARRIRASADARIIEELTALKGVGPWTAQMLLIFSLGRPDVLPVGDYGVRKGAQIVYALPELPDARQLESLATRWRPYCSVASWYLWRATEARYQDGAAS
jgi:DNA-3-methyladenine glycosylase II